MHREETENGLSAVEAGPYAEISHAVIGAAIEVHRVLGPGLLESVYEAALAHELSCQGHAVGRQIELPVEYKGLQLGCGFRIDLLVDDSVIVELKTIESFHPIHEAQLLSYMRLSGKRVGLLINFNVKLLKDGVRRRIL